MDGEAGNNSGATGTGTTELNGNSDASPAIAEGTEQQSGGEPGGGGGNTDTGQNSGASEQPEDFDGLTITYIDPSTNEIVQYARIEASDLERFLGQEAETQDSQAVQVSEDDAGAVPDFQMMFGSWAAIVVVALFACLGALCVNTLIRSLEVRKR